MNEGIPNEGPLSEVIRRNIDRLGQVRAERERTEGIQVLLAGQISRFAGSMACVYVHVIIVSLWLLINTGILPIVKPWDPYPFVMLAMAASVEAIFLSTFVLISQNRMQTIADRRADLDLQINLLAEHEITRLIEMVEAISTKLGVSATVNDLDDIKQDVSPELVVAELERQEELQQENG
jgi:uncharacterized membrane protein